MWVTDFDVTNTLSFSLEECINKVNVKYICICLPEENMFCRNLTTANVKFCSSFAEKVVKTQTNKMVSDEVSLKLVLELVKAKTLFLFSFTFIYRK